MGDTRSRLITGKHKKILPKVARINPRLKMAFGLISFLSFFATANLYGF